MTEEIGDTWIYGCASDPLKVARYREISRLREEWLTRGAFQLGDTMTWRCRALCCRARAHVGHGYKNMAALDNYTPSDLARMLDTKN